MTKSMTKSMTKPASKIDPEMAEFEAALLGSIDEVQAGKHGRVHSPADIAVMARRVGRPVKVDAKQPVKLRQDPDLLAALRASGRGWQTKVNSALRREFLGA